MNEMIQLDNLPALLRGLEALKQERGRVEGRIEELHRRLKQFGVKSLKEARVKCERLTRLEQKEARLAAKEVKQLEAELRELAKTYPRAAELLKGIV